MNSIINSAQHSALLAIRQVRRARSCVRSVHVVAQLGAVSPTLCARSALSPHASIMHCRDISLMSRQGKSHVPRFSVAIENSLSR